MEQKYEKTLAREIYKKMKPGIHYRSYDLFTVIGEDAYYHFIPIGHPLHGKDVRKVIAAEMWKIVNTGYASTFKREETYHLVGGLKYNVKDRDWSKVPTETYTIRYWTRVK